MKLYLNNLQKNLRGLEGIHINGKWFTRSVSKSFYYSHGGIKLGRKSEIQETESMRRGRFEIMSDILSIVRDPSTKTRIVYGANLSFAQAKRYLNSLLENDLITSLENENTEYEITENGWEFLRSCEELEALLTRKKMKARIQ